MEIHRLKQMGDYDPEVFKLMHKKTRALVKSLTRHIDERRFNVSRDIVESWFDDKLIYVFNKYYERFKDKPDVLLGHIINALKLFKFRIIKASYNKNGEIARNLIDMGQNNELLENIPEYDDTEFKEELCNQVHKYMKAHLSDDDAFLVWEVLTYPPDFILNKMRNPSSRIPSSLICEYFGVESSTSNVAFINDIREEIRLTILKAKIDLNPKPTLAFFEDLTIDID